MSNKLLTFVWDHGPEDKGELMVLLALADQASDAGHCWPSMPTIARRCRVEARSCQRIVRRLEAGGWLTVHERPGRSNMYSITAPPDPGGTPDTGSPLTQGRGDPPVRGGVTPRSGEGCPPGHPNPKGTLKEPKERAPRRSATRLKADWVPSDWMIEFAMREGLTDAAARKLADAMRDWSMSTTKGVKLDWDATWRGFVRREVMDIGKTNGKSDHDKRAERQARIERAAKTA